MKVVKNVCKFCGKAEEFTWKEKILLQLKNIVFGFMTACSLAFIFLLIYLGPDFVMDTALNAGYYHNNMKQDDELRVLAMDITKECEGSHVMCFSRELFDNVSQIRYVPTSKYRQLYDPLYVYEYGGDCKNTANMMVALHKSLGFTAFVECNHTAEHCVAIVRDDFNDNFILIDLTIPLFTTIDDVQEVWELYES